MKNVRIWFRKDGACRFISHLDVNRAMTRALRMSGVPLWHTEGYNSRLYLSFTLPLSLGFRGENESMDVRFLEDNYPFEAAVEKINACLPEGLTVFKISDPVMKPSAVTYGMFIIKMNSDEYELRKVYKAVQDLLGRETILTEKKSKNGIKTVDIKEKIVKYNLSMSDGYVLLDVVLPAGNTVNVNPALVISAVEAELGCNLFADVTRRELYSDNFELFR